MLTAAQLDVLPEPILELYREYEETVIYDIARRLGKSNMTTTAAWQIQRVTESGMVYEQALKELAMITGRSETELRKMFADAGVKATAFDDRVYRAAGLNPLPLNLSPAMVQVLVAGLRRTQASMRNLTASTALAGQEAFTAAADLAYLQVSSGAMSYTDAIAMAVDNAAKEGLRVVSYAGRKDQLDVAMRRAVLTGVGQTVGEIQMGRLSEMGAKAVQTSAHAGARNTGTGPANHESWQGRVFSLDGSGKYPPFVETTGYGTGEGIHGWNCRHSFFPFFPGISQNIYDEKMLSEFADRKVTFAGKEMSFYEGTQQQRAIERKIRHWKRRAGALEAAGVTNSAQYTAAARKVADYQALMRRFVAETGIKRQRIREQIR